MILTLTPSPAFVSAREGRWEPGRASRAWSSRKTLGIVGSPIGGDGAAWRGPGHAPRGWTGRAPPARGPRPDRWSLRTCSHRRRCDAASGLHEQTPPAANGCAGGVVRNTARAKLVDNEALVELLRAAASAARRSNVTRRSRFRPATTSSVPSQRPHHPAHRLHTREGLGQHAGIAIETVQAFARGDAARRQPRLIGPRRDRIFGIHDATPCPACRAGRRSSRPSRRAAGSSGVAKAMPPTTSERSDSRLISSPCAG